MPDATLTTLAVATGGAFLGKFVGPTAEHYGKLALERAQQLGAKATALLAQVGREPQPVEPKLLLPLVQAASLETDEMLAEKWAALLANAADPAGERTITPAYTDILRQLTSHEVRLLDMLFDEAKPHFSNPSPASSYHDPYTYGKSWATSKMLNPKLLYQVKMRKQNPAHASLKERIELDRLDAMIDNLLRQQILILAKGMPPKDKRGASSDFEPEMHNVFFTSLGYDFMHIVTAPANIPLAT
jgi:hypothetical protein